MKLLLLYSRMKIIVLRSRLHLFCKRRERKCLTNSTLQGQGGRGGRQSALGTSDSRAQGQRTRASRSLTRKH